MKTIFTLVIALGLVSAAQAQDRRDARQRDQQVVVIKETEQRGFDYGYDDNAYHHDVRYIKSNPGMQRKIARQINAINQEFDFKIQRVQRNFYMNRWEKQRQIRSLEQQRQFEIRRVYAKFRHNKYGRDDRRY
jgi:hypothetical protein